LHIKAKMLLFMRQQSSKPEARIRARSVILAYHSAPP